MLYRVVRDHFETFRARAADLRDGEGLPRFVEQEFRDFLQCGSLTGGFARFRWTGSDGTKHLLFYPVDFLEHLVALTPRPRINPFL